jgi:hypothetical protein
MTINGLRDKLYRAERDVLVAMRNVVQQLVRRPLMPRFPYDVRQRDSKSE